MTALDIDVYDPEAYVDDTPHEQFQKLRDEAPIYRHRHPDGGYYWLVSRHADIIAVSRDHASYSAQRGFVLIDELPPEILEPAQSQLLGMDPPAHNQIRRQVIKRFTTRMINELAPKIEALASEIFDALAKRREADFVEDVSAQLPTSVICMLMGIPKKDWEQIRHWADKQTSASDPDIVSDPKESQEASIAMGAYGYELAQQRSAADPTEDLISLLMHQEIDGQQVNEMEFASLFIQLTVAGNETTRGLISSGMLELMRRPEDYRALENDPTLIPRAIEEMLRYTCPLHYFRRTATCDTTLGGQRIAEGDRVVMCYSSGNRDERVFENPHAFDIRRDPNPHLSFGHGIHLCLGAHLARLETKIFFEQFFRRFGSIELAGNPARIRSNLINGLKRMPVRVTPNPL